VVEPFPSACRREKRADARDELRPVEGLRQVVVGAEEQPGRSVEALHALAGDEDDPELGIELLAQPLADLVAVQARGG
jgi:hypothetical protein